MKCPNDNVDLQRTTYKGCEIDVCVGCKGIWLDYGVLTEILTNSEPDWSPAKEQRILQRLSKYNIAPLGEDRDLVCPHCGEILDEVNYQGNSNIIVNPCSAGHGLWLDHGELLSIRVFLNHWAQFAQDNEELIHDLLDGVDQRIRGIRQRVLDQAPGSIGLVNEMVYEALRMLDRD